MGRSINRVASLLGFYMEHSPGGGFLRILGHGVSWTALKPLFSERYGYRKPFVRIGRIRFFWLPRPKIRTSSNNTGKETSNG